MLEEVEVRKMIWAWLVLMTMVLGIMGAVFWWWQAEGRTQKIPASAMRVWAENSPYKGA